MGMASRLFVRDADRKAAAKQRAEAFQRDINKVYLQHELELNPSIKYTPGGMFPYFAVLELTDDSRKVIEAQLNKNKDDIKTGDIKGQDR